MADVLTDALTLMRDTLANCPGWQTWCGAANASEALAFINQYGVATDANFDDLPRCVIHREEFGYSRGIASGAFRLVFFDQMTLSLPTEAVQMVGRIGTVCEELWTVSRSGAADYLDIREPPRIDGDWQISESTEQSKYKTVRQAVIVSWGLERE